MKRYLITLALVALLAVAGTVFAAPSSVDRITNRIEPLIKTDFIRAVYFVATSTTASSTFANGLNITGGCFAVNNVCITAGGGGGSGVVNPGTQGQNAFYDSTGAIVSGTSTIFVSTASNVGIGTTTPTSKLSVIGSISGDSVNTTSTTATSTFLGKLQVGTYAGVPQIVGPDIDTGIHFDGPDIFSVHTGGTTKFLINSSGNVGIGTTSPLAKLNVYSGPSGVGTANTAGNDLVVENNADGGISVLTPNANNSFLMFGSPSDNFGAGAYWNNSTDLLTILTANTGADISFQTGDQVEAMRIFDSGNIAIGTSTADLAKTIIESNSSILSVLGLSNRANSANSRTYLNFYDNTAENSAAIGSAREAAATDWGLIFRTGSGSSSSGPSDRMYISAAGNVGIGTTSPARALHLEGVGGATMRIQRNDSAGANGILEFTGNDGGVDGSISYNNRVGGALTFETGGSTNTRMTIDQNGLVGIGTTSPYGKLAVTGTVIGQNFVATSTAATSTFQGNIVISPDGENPYGFAAGPLVMEGPLAGPYQQIIANTLDSSVSLAGLTIGNSKFKNPGFSADYYCGFYMAAPSYALPGLDGVLPNGGALFCKDGPITIGSATSTTGPEIRFQATGMGANNLDAVIEGSTGHFGIGTTSPMARLDVAGPATGNLFQVSSVSGSATTSRLFVAGGGNVGLGTTTPRAPLDIGGLIPANVGGINSGQASVLISQNINSTSGVGMVNMNNGAGAEFRFAISDSAFNDYIAFNQPNPSNSGTLFGETKASSSLIFTNGTGNRRLLMGTVNAAPVAFGTSNTERMRITAAGNVGIATTTPSGTLAIVTGTNRYAIFGRSTASTDVLALRGDDNGVPLLRLQNLNTAATTNHGFGINAYFGISTSTKDIAAGRLSFIKEQQWDDTPSTQDSAILFATTRDGSQVEAGRFTSAGTFNIGTTTPDRGTFTVQGAASTYGMFSLFAQSGNNNQWIQTLWGDTAAGSPAAEVFRMGLQRGGLLALGTTTPIGMFNMSSTSPTIALSDTTNASHWNIANNDGVFSLSTTSSALVRTETNAVTILNNGNFGVSSSTPAEEFSIGGVGSATSTAYFDSGTGKGSCMIIADTDGSGVTYVTANNGVLTASTVPCN